MSEDKQPTAVEREDYNKVVESANSAKAENEKLKKELEDIKNAKTEETKKAEIEKTANDKVEEQKQAWEKEKEDKDKMIEDLKKQAEDKNDTVVKKGIVQDKPDDKEVTSEQVATEIGKQLGTLPEKDPKNFANRWSSYAHYKNPTTKQFSNEQFGKALSLHAGAIENNDVKLNPNQRGLKREATDIIIPRTYGTDKSE